MCCGATVEAIKNDYRDKRNPDVRPLAGSEGSNILPLWRVRLSAGRWILNPRRGVRFPYTLPIFGRRLIVPVPMVNNGILNNDEVSRPPISAPIR